ncbi:MAG TPA: glycoside hydrolase family 6 protein [Solirubrobacteraceae bacterium]
MFRLLSLLLAALACQLAITTVAGAEVHLSSTRYTVAETDQQATITVQRTGSLRGDEYVRYGTHRANAVAGIDYENAGATLHFASGQAQATFTVPIVTRNWRGPSVHAAVYLYGSWPEKLGPHDARLVIEHNAALDLRDPTDPLELSGVPNATGNPLAGATFYADPHHSPAAVAASRLHRRHPREAGMIQAIADQPFTDRFGAWNGRSPAGAVFQFLRNADVQAPEAIPTVATYWIVNGQCARGGTVDSAARVAAYERFIDGLSQGIGNFRAVLFLEMDSLITTPCLHGHALAVRMQELHYAITTLEQNPHLLVYVDAGAGDALSYRTAARLLTREGVHQAQGFFLNSTHFDWTTSEIAYGQKLSRALGGVHFVVSTSDNGQGPLRPRDRVRHGNEILCNPAGRGLGPRPTTSPGYALTDAFAWIALPGKSGGACGPGVKAPPTGDFWPAYAAGLVRHANYGITGPDKGRLTRAR